MTTTTPKMDLECQKCTLVWEYKGEKKPSDDFPVYVTCPRCRSNIKMGNRGEL